MQLPEDCLVEGGIGAVRIRDLPVFDLRGIVEGDVANAAAEIYDQIGIVPGFVGNGLGGKTDGGIAIARECFLGFVGDFAERIEAGAGGLEDICGLALGNGFGHGAAAGVSNADEEDTKFLSGHELSWS